MNHVERDVGGNDNQWEIATVAHAPKSRGKASTSKFKKVSNSR